MWKQLGDYAEEGCRVVFLGPICLAIVIIMLPFSIVGYLKVKVAGWRIKVEQCHPNDWD